MSERDLTIREIVTNEISRLNARIGYLEAEIERVRTEAADNLYYELRHHERTGH